MNSRAIGGVIGWASLRVTMGGSEGTGGGAECETEIARGELIVRARG
jgi:hypothetical protein